MVSGQTLMAFAGTSIVLIAVPGPNHLHIMGSRLAGTRLSGLAAAWGVETGLLLHIGIAAAGLSYGLAQSAALFDLIRYAGAGYLLYLALRSLRHHCRSAEVGPADSGGAHGRHQPNGSADVRPRRAYTAGVLITTLNPKVILVFAVIVPPFIDYSVGDVPAQVAVLGLALLVLAIPFDLTYVIAGAALARLLHRRPVILCYQQTLLGAVFLVLAVLTLPVGDWL